MPQEHRGGTDKFYLAVIREDFKEGVTFKQYFEGRSNKKESERRGKLFWASRINAMLSLKNEKKKKCKFMEWNDVFRK